MKNAKYFFSLLFVLSFLTVTTTFAQDNTANKVDIKLSKKTQVISGKTYYVHVVEQGQTLFSISRAYGTRYQDTHIKTDVDKLAIGDTVWIPTTAKEEATIVLHDPNAINYEVQKGETLYGIAKKFNVKESDIISLNPILANEVVKAGQVLKLPGSAKATETTTKPTTTTTTASPAKNETESVKDDDIVTSDTLPIRDKIDKNSVTIALLMPFYLSEASEISVSKADIEQKRKRSYKSFKFIQFYEGILLALNKLEANGFSVKLQVYDVGEDDTKKVQEVFAKPEMQKADFVIALLYQKGFQEAANLAKKNNLFIINPLSSRSTILDNNPYVFKIAPTEESYAKTLINFCTNSVQNPNLIVIHSPKNKDQVLFKSFKANLEKQTAVPYTLYDWGAPSSSLRDLLNNSKNNIVVSTIMSESSSSQELYASSLLNRLVSIKKNPPTLFAPVDFLYLQSVDINYLQTLNFSFVDNYYLSSFNATHDEFIKSFTQTYKTIPDGFFAASGYDIMLYFVMGLDAKGNKFWKEPNLKNYPIRLINPYYFKKTSCESGYENTRSYMYQLDNFKIVPLKKIGK